MYIETLRERPIWGILGIALAAFLCYFLQSFVGTFVFGLFFYYVSRPVYRPLHRHVPSRGVAAGLALSIVALPLVGLLLWVSIAALREYRLANVSFVSERLSPVLSPYLDLSPVRSVSGLPLPTSVDAIRTALGTFVQYLSVFGIGITHLVLMILLAFYLLRDDHRLVAWGLQFDDDGYLERFFRAVDSDLHHIFFGNILNAAFAGVIASVLYLGLGEIAPAGLGIPHPVLLGALAAVASLIPIVGMKLVYLPVSGYLYAVAYLSPADPGYWFPTSFLVLSFVVVDSIPDIVLRPYVSGKNTHVGMLMLSYIFGPLLFGWYGLFLTPILLVLVLQYSRIILPELVGSRPTPARQTLPPSSETDSELPPENTPEGTPLDSIPDGVDSPDETPRSSP